VAISETPVCASPRRERVAARYEGRGRSRIDAAARLHRLDPDPTRGRRNGTVTVYTTLEIWPRAWGAAAVRAC